MRKTEIELYEFNELSEAAKAKVLSHFSGINTTRYEHTGLYFINRFKTNVRHTSK